MLPPSRIRSLLNRRHPDWYVGDLIEVGRGLSATVYRGETATLGTVAIRVSHQRWAASDNDPEGFDTRAALCQGAALARHMMRFGVPVPAVHSVDFSEEADLLVTVFVDGDGASVADEQLGELAARVHATELFPGLLIAQTRKDVYERVVTRLCDRAATLSRCTGIPLPLPPVSVLRERLRGEASRLCTLHMDLRPANVIARDGQVLALVDWDNALRGRRRWNWPALRRAECVHPRSSAAIGGSEAGGRASGCGDNLSSGYGDNVGTCIRERGTGPDAGRAAIGPRADPHRNDVRGSS